MPGIFALILTLSMSFTIYWRHRERSSAIIKHDALYYKSIFVHDITLNLRYLSGFTAVYSELAVWNTRYMLWLDLFLLFKIIFC